MVQVQQIVMMVLHSCAVCSVSRHPLSVTADQIARMTRTRKAVTCREVAMIGGSPVILKMGCTT